MFYREGHENHPWSIYARVLCSIRSQFVFYHLGVSLGWTYNKTQQENHYLDQGKSIRTVCIIQILNGTWYKSMWSLRQQSATWSRVTITYIWVVNVFLSCDEPELNILVTMKTMFFCCFFKPLKKIMLEINILLVRKVVFFPIYKVVVALYPLRSEVRKGWPYHYAFDHIIQTWLEFIHDIESLCSMAKILVEFVPRH